MKLERVDDFNCFQIEMRSWYNEKEKKKISIVRYIFIMLFLLIVLVGAGNLLKTKKVVEKESTILDANGEVFDITQYGNYSEAFIQNYVHNKDNYIIEDIEERYLKEYELEKYTKSELALMRNEIFARHGFIYEKEPYVTYFGNKTWYDGYVYEVGFEDLTIEAQANISLIKRIESIKE